MTLLAVSTRAQPGRNFESIEGLSFNVFVDRALCERSGEIELGMYGFVRRRLQACWNGCIFVI